MENGVYRARAVKGGLGETAGGQEQVAVEFELLDEGFQNQGITWFGYFTEKSFEITMKALRACGWQGDNINDLVGLTSNTVELVIEKETYEGKTRSKVKWVNPEGGGGLALKAPLDPVRATRFAASMRGKIAAFDQTGGQKKSRTGAQSPEPPTHTDSDIPF